jgi:hypothetical protein
MHNLFLGDLFHWMIPSQRECKVMGEYGVSIACIIGSTELLSFFFLLSTLTTGEHSPSM